MKKLVTIIFAIFALTSCFEELETPVVGSGIEDGYMTIDFGHKNFGSIDISTRSTVSTAAEDAVINVYVLMFDADGKRVFGEFFDRDNRVDSQNALNTSASDSWYVNNEDSGAGGQTTGSIRFKAPSNLTGKIYLIANLDPAIFNLTDDRLNMISTEADLHKLSLKFNQESAARTGNLLMLGYTTIEIANDNLSLGVSSIPLVRLDAKIEVKVGIVPGAVTVKENGATQEIESFTPTSWRVVNLPKDTWLMPRGDDVVAAAVSEKKDGGYFNTTSHLFETKEQNTITEGTRTLHGFSFYMTESYQTMKNTVGSDYHLRDKREKNADGTYKYPESSDEDIWVYAPKDAAYLVIEGDVQMKVNEQASSEALGQTLNAMVRYYVHLGDFRPNEGSLDNYDIERNTHYTYTINIKGVNNIEIEVEKDNDETTEKLDNENQSGATGEVYIAQEEIFTFDAHYDQRVYTFNFAAMLHTIGIKIENGEYLDESGTKLNQKAVGEIANALTWYVSTPFGRKGSPDIVNNGVEVPAGLDYKWVYFLKNAKEDGVNRYKQTGQWYPGDPMRDKRITDPESSAYGETLMNVSALCTYLREQITKKALGDANDFDVDDNLVFTAYVDEFYYEADPITGVTSDNLWHQFVNQPTRMMHILCSAEASKDGESSATGSVVTIRQRSIQTVYNTETAVEAWGTETVDEIRAGKAKIEREGPYAKNSVGFFVKDQLSHTVGDREPVGNSSKNNGLYNTARLWKLVENDNQGNDVFVTSARWDTYMDMERPNDYDGTTDNKSGDLIYGYMKDPYITLRYSCMSRNRDNNGNGVIDKDEIKWYLASTEQLMTLFIGDQGLSTESQLYNLENPTADNYACRVVSSTHSVESDVEDYCTPDQIWAEEGCSVSYYNQYAGDGGAGIDNYGVRCVRNFGLDPETNEEYDLLDIDSSPRAPIRVEKVGDNYRLDLSLLNPVSQRIKVVEELVPQNEASEMAKPYKAFETGPLGDNGSGGYSFSSGTSYPGSIFNELMNGKSPCPAGYRLPNIREGAIIYLYVDDDLNDDGVTDNDNVRTTFWSGMTGQYSGFAVSSYYRFGPSSTTNYRGQDTYSWRVGADTISINYYGTRYIRCVRDVDL